MKRKLLLLLCSVLTSVSMWAWTSVTPQVGRSYYLYNTEFSQFWYASSTLLGENRYYGVTGDIAAATPIYVETAGDGYSYTFSFYLGGEKWFINQYDGKTYLYKSGSFFKVWANEDGKYYLRTQEYTSGGRYYRHYLNAESASGTCNFPASRDQYCEWHFIAVEEAMSYMANHCASVAETNYVSGWERVTSVSALQTNPENYYYAIFSTNSAALMVRTNKSDGIPYYVSAATPINFLEYLFEINNYTYSQNDYFVLKSVGNDKYYTAASGVAYNLHATKSGDADDNCRLTFNVSNGAWDIATWTSTDNGSKLGLWTPGNGYKDGEKMAGNKTDATKGSFLIYRLPKSRMANVDMTALMPTGIKDWTCVQGNGPAQYLETGATETYSDNGDTYKIFKAGKIMYQTVTNMPRGKYRVTFYAVVNSANNVSHASGPNLVQAYVNDETLDIDVVEQSSCTPSDYSRSITCTLDEYGSLEYGLKVKDGVTDAGNWALCKNVSLIYLGETLTQEASVFTSPSAVTGDIWYKYTETSAGWYVITSSAATTLSYTQDGTKSVGDNDFSTLTLAAGVSQCLLLTSNPLYFKSSNAATLTITALTSGMDITSCITNPSFETGTRDGWDRNAGNVREGGYEIWHANGSYVKQTLSGLPSGYYRVSCQALHGEGESAHSLLYAKYGEEEGDVKTAEATVPTETTGSEAFGHETGRIQADHSLGRISIDVNVNGGSLELGFKQTAGAQWDVFSNFTLTYLGDASANLTVSDGKLGTFIAPFKITLPENVKAYSATSNETSVTLTKIAEGGEDINAGTPVIIYGDGANVNTNFYGTSTVATNQTVGALTGILNNSDKTIASGKYVLQTQGGNQAFYKLASSATGKLNRCYVTASVGVIGARLTIDFDDDDPTAISTIEAAEEGEVLKDGKYLIDGQIVIVKNGVKYSANGQIIK